MKLERIVEIILSGDMDKFYKSTEWINTRARALERDKNECQHCKANGGFKPADCVHHIKFLKIEPQLALQLNNLVSLCNSCHNIVHPEKVNRKKAKHKINIPERW